MSDQRSYDAVEASIQVLLERIQITFHMLAAAAAEVGIRTLLVPVQGGIGGQIEWPIV